MHVTENSLKTDIGCFLRQARINKALTGEELGKLMNVSQQQISRYENGITNLSIETLDRLLIILDVTWHCFILRVIKKHSQAISDSECDLNYGHVIAITRRYFPEEK